MKRMKSLVIASLLAPALAFAQPKTADEWYTEGEAQYNLGDFDKAAEAFKQGFAAETDESKKPAYLYNVAQAYRQGNKCRDSAFFYKRYLTLKEQDTVKPLKPEKRAEVEQKIAELEECAKTQPGGGGTTTTPKPVGPGTTTKPVGPGTTTKPVGPGTTASKPVGPSTTATKPVTPKPTTTVGQVEGGGEGEVDGEVDGEEDEDGVTDEWQTMPKLGSARFELGASKIFAGDIDMGTRAAFTLIGGYPVFMKDKLLVEAGGLFSYTAIPYTNFMTQASGTASMITFLANASGTYTVAPKISARGDFGLGFLTFAGARNAGNPFTENGVPTTGALTMFALRIAASVDYAITPNIIATATPLSFSISPATDGLRTSAFTRLDFLVGVGYRM